MDLIDLTRTLDPDDLERLPPEMRTLGGVLAPDVTYAHPAGAGRQEFAAAMACGVEDLPGGEGWGSEILNGFSSHLGTHVDAPLHYGSTCEGRPARTITDIALRELWCEAVVLDLRGRCTANTAIPVSALRDAVDEIGGAVPRNGAVLLRTGQEEFGLRDAEFFQYPGMSREGTLFLAELGAKVLGSDAAGWDLPFPVMAEAFRASGDNAVLWDGHRAGREREVFIVQQLANLAALPPTGFRVAFFPLKLARASAAPARVVAFV
ncbi:cyclase family protein [Streptomyces sp. NBC_00654]|uniref:cyclase family protein n=1 Tax=Streptomyces sp. NBC_00654 TaxID=2975799 RepID=UPI00225ADC72|nr:cyclase family protein [Streptomyces sp. NBC_00654]MCX4966678.1 cyclase family protein [Streptomyces sp. NBC_00654]